MITKNIVAKLFICSLLHLSIQAAEISTLIVTLINESTHELVFDHAEVKKPGNTLKIDKNILKPTETAYITGTTTTGFDLSGNLYFKNHAGRFFIEDRRQFHSGQPIFSMHSDKIASKVTSQTYNPVKGPRLLSYTAATVVLKNKL